MTDTEMASTSRVIGIILMVLCSIPGIFLLFLSSRAINPIFYKVKELSFVPVQGTINNVTIYESRSTEKRRSSNYTGTRSGVDAYFIRLAVTFSYNNKSYSVDAKKFSGQFETFTEAYSAVKQIAPQMPVTVEYYYKKKITMPEQIEFLKNFNQKPVYLANTIDFKINKNNPNETSLDDPYIRNKIMILLLTIVFFVIPIILSWLCIKFLGKSPGFANGILLLILIIDCLIAFIINKASPQIDYLANSPKFGFVIDSNFKYKQIEQYVVEE
jgi:hypothetical protein